MTGQPVPASAAPDGQAAGICTTVLKKICRKHGLKRWPSRRLRSIDKQVALLRGVIDGAEGGDSSVRREILEQVELLRAERARITLMTA